MMRPLLSRVRLPVFGLLAITGLRPMSPAHVLLAIAALLVLPAAAGLGLWRERQGGPEGTRHGWLAVGAIITVVLGLTLAATG